MDMSSIMGMMGGGGEGGAAGIGGAAAGASPYGAAISAVGGVAEAALGGGAASGDVSDRSPVHVAPIGVNFGAILQPFNAGSPENGGYGMDLMSRWAPKQVSMDTLVSSRGEPMNWPLIIGGLAVVGIGVFLLRKKGII